ncbi:MAG TPA: acetate--CoA ligase [Tepidisphaeraceae bacterium]|nr:acetate--CoA ligase [Tepidisphaeraceae bacterium]
MSEAKSDIQSSMQEHRTFQPPADFSAAANIKSRAEYDAMYRQSMDQPDVFWANSAKQLYWFEPWKQVLEWKWPYAQWFVGGKTNLAYNCLDHQIAQGRGEKTAILWEGEPEKTPGDGGDVRRITYSHLKQEVCRFANGLKSLGVKKGDRVTIYMPMVPEAAIAILACARIGAVHSVIFGGFSSQAIADRVEDAKSDLVITADGGFRRGSVVQLKANVEEALKKTGRVRKVIVLKRTGQQIPWNAQRDIWWDELVREQSADCPAEAMDAEDLLFVLYTSGSTGKPKGIIHTTGGYMVGTYLTTKYVFDIHESDIYWCTADVGWITGHSYVIYGPLNNGATTFMYEGAPNYPDFGRFWAMVERHGVSVFYTAPTAIRAFMRAGKEFPERHILSSLRLLGTVGEPINPEAWMWYHHVIGGGNCPIVDTWWQTETGAIMITPLPGVTPTKPGTATLPFFGVDAAIVDRSGKEMPVNQGGLLAIRRPWPSMLRGILNDPDRYVRQYWSDVPGFYFTGDGARRDEDGYFWIMGRVDDVINVSGHRLGTAEIESALVSHPSVAEAAVVGMPHEIKGQGIAAFVTVRSGIKPTDALRQELIDVVAQQIGSLAKPDQIRFTDSLPKTRSGKIMRRLLKELAGGGDVKGDMTTLEDFSVLARLKESEEG